MTVNSGLARMRSRSSNPVVEHAPQAVLAAQRSGDKRNPTVVRLTPEQTRVLKIHCANADTTIQEFLLDAIRAEFARLGLTAFPDSDS